MIFWGGRRAGLGCGSLLLTSVVIFLVVYAFSGGQCGLFIFP